LVVLCLKKSFWEEDVDRYVQDIADTRSVQKDNLHWFRDMMVKTVSGMSSEERVYRMQKQVYLALWFLLAQAAHMHIDACPMEWFLPHEFDRILWLADYQTVVVCPIGYRSDEDKYADVAKVRYDTSEVIEWK
jgi:nitroreductase